MQSGEEGGGNVWGDRICWDLTVGDFEFQAKRSGFIYMQWRAREYLQGKK